MLIYTGLYWDDYVKTAANYEIIDTKDGITEIVPAWDVFKAIKSGIKIFGLEYDKSTNGIKQADCRKETLDYYMLICQAKNIYISKSEKLTVKIAQNPLKEAVLNCKDYTNVYASDDVMVMRSNGGLHTRKDCLILTRKRLKYINYGFNIQHVEMDAVDFSLTTDCRFIMGTIFRHGIVKTSENWCRSIVKISSFAHEHYVGDIVLPELHFDSAKEMDGSFKYLSCDRLDLSRLHIPNIESMRGVFCGVFVKELILPRDFDFTNVDVTDMFMFSKIGTLNLNGSKMPRAFFSDVTYAMYDANIDKIIR